MTLCRRMTALVLAIVLPAASANAQQPTTSSPVQGAWRIVEVTRPTGSNPPQTGFVLFTATHYSIVRSDTDRPDFKDQSKPTPEEALVVWGAVQPQAGEYDITGNNLNTTVLVSKNPQGMRTKAKTTWTLKLDGDTLVMTEMGSNNPRTFRLVRAE